MRKKMFGSVQRQYVRAREMQGEILCLAVPGAPNKRTYVSVLEISPVNFLLKAEEEQEALLHRYSALLKALTFPLQILVRNQRFDLRPYLASIRAQVLMPENADAPREEDTDIWPELASDLEHFLNHLGSRRTLLTRQCYLVIPAPESFGAASRAPGERRSAACPPAFRTRGASRDDGEPAWRLHR